MLILPIKKKWFDMIRSGQKREEYREIKRYYTSRFKTVGLLDPDGNETKLHEVPIMFRNGYDTKSPSFVAYCWLSIGYGRPEWGAEPGKKYYRLHILRMEKELKK
jgi:hypothetical protein